MDYIYQEFMIISGLNYCDTENINTKQQTNKCIAG